jgi:hypothetical protein
MSDSNDPVEMARRLAESFRQVRFGPGVVGKTSYVLLALIGVWALVIWRLSSDVVLDAALMLAAGVVTAICLWWMRRTHAFAEKNPGLALLEGAHLLAYQRFLAQAKGHRSPESQAMSHAGAATRAVVVDPDEGSE